MKNTVRTLYYTIRSKYIHHTAKYEDYTKIHWSYKDKNFGDILNPILFKMLTGENAVPINAQYYKHSNFLMIGSILQYANKHSVIFGSGFISKESVCKEKPFKVYAVRGKLTRNKLLEQGIACPEVYGDPALLMPYIYKPNIEKKYKLGIIPHYMDKDNDWINSIKNNKDVLIIDLITDNPLDVIDKILSCNHVASSSLHGLIISDAYKIPSIWVKFSNKLIGGNFKFLDYFSSVNKNIKNPLSINSDVDIDILVNKTENPNINIDLKKLIDNFPFRISNKFLNVFKD